MAAVLAARLCPDGRALLCCPVREALIWTAFCKALAAASLQAKVGAGSLHVQWPSMVCTVQGVAIHVQLAKCDAAALCQGAYLRHQHQASAGDYMPVAMPLHGAQVWSYEPLAGDEGLASEDGRYEGGFKLVACCREHGSRQPWWDEERWQPLDFRVESSQLYQPC